MSLISASLKRPVAVVVIVFAVVISSLLAIRTIPIDIFPRLNLPVIYVIEPYGGMTPQQMEGFFSTRLQDQFLYINGIKNISSRNLQGIAILKLTFFESTNMAEASAQVALQLNRALQFFPPGALPPQVIRFDASSLPVGTLVFSSPDRKLEDIADLAATRIRPMFASIPGISTPPPVGSNQRTVVINMDPDRLRSFNLTADEVVKAIAGNNVTAPSGDVRIGNVMYMATTNALESKVKDFGDIPVKTNNLNTVFVRDIGRVEDAADVTTGYALIDGRRSIYMPVVKTPDASTWEVVQALKARIPEMQSLLPEDVHIDYVFDQSVFVMNSVKSLVSEGVLGAILTGLMVILFLRDWRSCVVVILTIPLSVLSAVVCLKLAGQTINIMTLSGLALAIGVLVDEATVTIENIHQHLEAGKAKKQAIYDACEEISFPKLLILLCILAVFAPSFVMQGVPRALFLPLSLSIGFAMISSFLLSQTIVPIVANLLLRPEDFRYKHGQPHAHAGLGLNRAELSQIEEHTEDAQHDPVHNNLFERIKLRYLAALERSARHKRANVVAYLLLTIALSIACFLRIGKDMLPHSKSGQYQVRLALPEGTRIERTETTLLDVLHVTDSLSGGRVRITSAYVGMIPGNNATANLFVFNHGPHEASLQIQFDPEFRMGPDAFREAFREQLARQFPTVRVSFEPMELTEKIMSQGASTPIEVQVAGKDMKEIEDVAGKLEKKLKAMDMLRDVRIVQPIHYPTIHISLDRYKIAQLGLSLDQISRSVSAFTSSSRFTEKNLWLDTKSAYSFQVQAQVQEYIMNSLDDIREIPVDPGHNNLVLQDVATIVADTTTGEYDRDGPRRYVTVSANLCRKDLGSGTDAVREAISTLGELPKGLVVAVQGMSDLLIQTLSSLQSGLLFAVVVIFLLLSANYESFRVSLAVLSTIPAVLLGALVFLLLTGATLNLQSYMGIIMSTGVSVANSILIVTNAEKIRTLRRISAAEAVMLSAAARLRPILMTTMAMVAGMIPMASGLGEAGDQSAPLGRAVIGGLIASTCAALFVVPQVYAWLQGRASLKTTSLMPETENENHEA
jgi:multidrug efflux pump subunit AcrB